MEGLAMLWVCIAAAGAGTLLGLLRLRFQPVLVGSVFLVAINIAMAARGRWPLLDGIVNVFLLLTTLQVSYFAALILSSATRVASRDRIDASTGRM
jgi:hypothetical protein